MASTEFRLFPVWAVLGIVLGSVAADPFIPELGYEQPFALAIPALILSLGLLAGPIVAAARSPASLLRAEPMLCVGLVYWITLDGMQGSYGLWKSSYESIGTAFYGIALFACMIWIGSALRVGSFTVSRPDKVGDISPKIIFIAGLVAGLCGITKQLIACDFSLACFTSSLFVKAVSLQGLRADVFGLKTLIYYMGFAGFLTLPLAAVLLRVERHLSWRVILLGALGVLILLLTIQAGGRRYVGMVIGATGLIWTLLHQHIRLKHLVRLGFLAAILLLVLEAMVSWRSIGVGAGLLSGEGFSGIGQGVISVDKNLHYMTAAMTVVPDLHPYNLKDGALYILGAPIPRSVWPSKPGWRGVNLLPYIGERKSAGFAWSCSAVCDFYLMGGALAIAVGGLIFGLLAGMLNTFLLRSSSIQARLIYAFGVMALFIGLRNVRDVVTIGFITLFLVITVIVVGRVLRRGRIRSMGPA